MDSQHKLSRRHFLRSLAAIGGTALASVVVAACAPAATTQAPAATTAPGAATAPTSAPQVATPKKGGKLTWGFDVPPTNMIPFGGISQGQVLSKEMFYDSLVEWDKDLNVKPALAESWTTPDEKTWIWKLRQGVKFHDGSEVTAEDVKYSIELQAKPPAPGSSVPQYPKIASVDVVDKYTAKFNMTGPDPTVLGYLAWHRYSPIIPKGLYDKMNVQVNAVGTGPFQLVEYVDNDRIVMKKNPNFWKSGQPYLDEMTYKVLVDETSRVTALRAGAIDGCVIGADSAKLLKNDPNVIVLKAPVSAPRVLQFTIKGDGKPWNKKEVRKAISKAIDRQELIDKVFSGEAVLTGPVPPGYGDWFIPDAELKTIQKYDPDGAKKLLADAGFANGFEITLHAISQPANYVLTAEVVKEQLKKVGIEVKIVSEELGGIAKRVGDGSFDFLATGRGMRHDVTGHIVDFGRPDQSAAKLWFSGPSGQGWKNDAAAKAFEELLVGLDPAKRKQQARLIQDVVLDEVPHVYLVQPLAFMAVRSYVKDMYVSFTNFLPGLRTVWVDKPG